MAANINNFNGLTPLIKEGTAELIHGIDDTRTDDIKKLAGNSILLKKALRHSSSYNDSKTVSNVDDPDYVADCMFLRYLAKQASENQAYETATTNFDDFSEFVNKSTSSKRQSTKGYTNSGNILILKEDFNKTDVDLSDYKMEHINATKFSSELIYIRCNLFQMLKIHSVQNTFQQKNNRLTYGLALRARSFFYFRRIGALFHLLIKNIFWQIV